MAISFNPMTQQAATSSFVTDTQGYIQGTYLDDPAMRFQLASGTIASSVTQPVWGGLPITLTVPADNSPEAGPTIALASTIAGIAGWTLFNQSHNMILTPGNNVPQADAGMTINFAKPGSLLRVAVKCNSTLLNNLAGGLDNVQVAWDFTNDELTTYSSGTALPVTIEAVSSTSQVVNYNSSTGAVTWDYAGPCAVIRI